MPPTCKRFGTYDQAARGTVQGWKNASNSPRRAHRRSPQRVPSKGACPLAAREFGIVGLERVAAAPAKLLRFPQRHLSLMDEAAGVNTESPSHDTTPAPAVRLTDVDSPEGPSPSMVKRTVSRSLVRLSKTSRSARRRRPSTPRCPRGQPSRTGRKAGLQIASEPSDYRVSHCIAVRIVVRPEIVDIDGDEAERTTLLREALLDTTFQARTIRQPVSAS